MASQPKIPVTAEEYLAQERLAETKSEYLNGEIFAMAGASRVHNRVVGSIFRTLDGQLTERPCEVFFSDMRVKVEPSGLYTYPDIVVACSGAKFEDANVDTLLNPVLIVEVLSPSTESYDRGKKFELYRKLDSLVEYVVVSQDKCHVEHFVRQPDGTWLFSETDRKEDTVDLPSIQCTLGVSEIYRKVKL